jgi:hypothetical protein
MRSQYPSVLPVQITERIKNIDNIYKINNIKLTPINKSYPLISTEAPRCEIYFPSDSVLNLENAILQANISFNHLGNGGATRANNYVQGVYAPRYGLASLIQEMNVYINGIQASTTKQYNFIHNWIKDWLSTFDVEINEGLNTCEDPSLIYNRPTAGGMAGYIVPRRGFPVCVWNDDAANNDINARQRMDYHLNLSDSVGFFAEGSSKILNTAILGEVKLELVFTSQIATCIAGSAVAPSNADTGCFGHIFPNNANFLKSTLNVGTETKGADVAGTTTTQLFARTNVETATGGVIFGDTGVPTLGVTDADRAGALGAGAGANQTAVIAGETSLFSIRDIVLQMEALQFKTSDYYDIMNRLVDSGAYKYHFKRYVIQSDAATTTRQIDYRLVVNSECVNYVLATFRPNGYDTLANPVNTQISASSVGHCGTLNATLKQQVSAGLPYTFNNSKFFVRNGMLVGKVAWRVDETFMEARTKQEIYIDNLRHWRYYKNGTQTKPHIGLKNYWDFVNTYFTAILSFETKSDDDVVSVYNLRGLNTNGKSIAITCSTETETNFYTAQNTAAETIFIGAANVPASTNALTYPINIRGFSQIDLNPAGAAIPTFLVCTTTTLELKGRREIDIKY